MFRTFLKTLIPAKYQFRLVSLKHTLTRFRRTFYSQNGEDIMIRSLFPKGYQGFYVDVGAHHPYRISNTYLLFKQGWHGINIDPNPETIALFEKARPKDTNLCIGVSELSDTLTYHRFSDPAVNTFSDEVAEPWKHKSWIEYLGSTEVSTQPLSAVFKKYISSKQTIDVLSIDVEGLDLEVLKSNDWNLYRPKVVVVEAHDFVLEDMQNHSIYQFLHEHGYQLIYVVKFSLIFTLPELLKK